MKRSGWAATLLVALGALFGSVPASAQTKTTVSGTITDPNGLPYAGARVAASIAQTSPGTLTLTPCSNPGAGCNIENGPSPVTADNAGHFTLNLWPNANIQCGQVAPSCTSYTFSVTITGTPPPLGTGPQSFTVTGVAVSGGSQDISATLSAAAPALANISSGSGAPCISPTNSLQKSTGGKNLGCSGLTDTGSQVNSSESVAIQGPRPWIDVTAYGADPTGTTDSTIAIQNAINAACGLPNSVTGTVLFPPGTYAVAQPQSPSTSPVFTTCSSVHIEGIGSSAPDQFSQGNQVQIIVTPGASPNDAPVFDIAATHEVIQNLKISGYTQAVAIETTAGYTWMLNDCLTTSHHAGTNNTPLYINTTIWLWVEHGCLDSASTSEPVAIIDQNSTSGSMGLLYFTNQIWSGAGVSIKSDAVAASGVFGNLYFRYITDENCGTAAPITITGTASNIIQQITLSDTTTADCTAPASIVLNSSSVTLQSVAMKSLGTSDTGIQVLAGSVTQGIEGFSSGAVVNASNVTTSNAYQMITKYGPREYIEPTGGALGIFGGNETLSSNGPIARFSTTGQTLSSLALSPQVGIGFGDTTNYGYNSAISEGNGAATTGFKFAAASPPTGVTGTPTTGGTVPAGTYYYFVFAGNNPAICSNIAYFTSSPSQPSAPVVVGGANNAVTVSWTAPSYSATTPIYYCVFRRTTNVWPSGNSGGPYTETSSTTILDDNSWTNTGYGVPPNPQNYSLRHEFTPTALGINNTSPAYDLDVTHATGSSQTPGVRAAAMTLTSTTVAALPSAASSAGTMYTVSDSTAIATEGQTCAGGGSTLALAFSNGINWKCF